MTETITYGVEGVQETDQITHMDEDEVAVDKIFRIEIVDSMTGKEMVIEDLGMITQDIQTQEIVDTKTGTRRMIIHVVTPVVQMDGEIMTPMGGVKRELEEEKVLEVVVSNVGMMAILQENALVQQILFSPEVVQEEEDIFQKKKIISTNYTKIAFHPG